MSCSQYQIHHWLPWGTLSNKYWNIFSDSIIIEGKKNILYFGTYSLLFQASWEIYFLLLHFPRTSSSVELKATVLLAYRLLSCCNSCSCISILFSHVCDRHERLYCGSAVLKPKDAKGLSCSSLSCNGLISMVECIYTGEIDAEWYCRIF